MGGVPVSASKPDRKRRPGPIGRPRLSRTLMNRPLGDPNIFRSADLLATNRRTAPGVAPLDLHVGGSPALTVDEQMQLIETFCNALRQSLITGQLQEEAP